MSRDYIPSCGCNDCTINRLQRELGDARQSIIDLQGANAAYVKANGRLHSELRAAKLLREGLGMVAVRYPDFPRLGVDDVRVDQII